MEMMEKIAYLKGLAEGLGLDDGTKEGKTLKVVIDLLDDIVLALADVGEDLVMMGEQLECMEEDLEEALEELYEDEDDDDDCCCGHHHDGFDGELYEVVCPSCGDTICVDENMLDDGEMTCPGCGELLEFDLGGELDGQDLADEPDGPEN